MPSTEIVLVDISNKNVCYSHTNGHKCHILGKNSQCTELGAVWIASTHKTWPVTICIDRLYLESSVPRWLVGKECFVDAELTPVRTTHMKRNIQ